MNLGSLYIYKILIYFYYLDSIITISENMAISEWFIAMLLVLLFITVLLIIVCIEKCERWEKYVIHESEAARGLHD